MIAQKFYTYIGLCVGIPSFIGTLRKSKYIILIGLHVHAFYMEYEYLDIKDALMHCHCHLNLPSQQIRES